MRKTKSVPVDREAERLAVTTEELQALLGCGRKTCVEIGEEAGARVQWGKRVLWNVNKVKVYLDLISA